MSSVVQSSAELLYEQDETAWLERMAVLAAEGKHSEIDYKNLSEYLHDMANRDRREVFSRLVVLMSHLLKCQFQPEKQTASWVATIREQRRELRMLLESCTLRNYASETFAAGYEDARKQASDETELELEKFPATCTWMLDDVLGEE